MFERMVSTLGRWVGKAPSGPAAREEEKDRRVWVRYPCTIETTSQVVNGAQCQRLSARVQDISRGGIHLIVSQRLEVGGLLSVELPGTAIAATSKVLACVARVTALPHGEWSLGCSFASELSEEDLQPLGARRLKSEDGDKRLWVRFPCQTQATFHSVRAKEPRQAPVMVMDISTNGIGLLVKQALEVGLLLSLELHGPNDKLGLSILASVVRVTARIDGEWAIGCNFIRELSDEELKGLV